MGRRMSAVSRLVRALIVAVALAAPAFGTSAAHADEGAVAVGTALQATSDVTLHRAEILKGSRVNVTKILKRRGRVDGVSVALADGHVVKVTIAQLHTFFRVVSD
jgi:hypothetical protein